MTYRIKPLHGGTYISEPNVGMQAPFKTARKAAIHQPQTRTDLTIGHGKRVLMSSGLEGASAWGIPNTDPDGGAQQDYPNQTDQRVVGRTNQQPITPGSILGLTVIAIGSGPTQHEPTPGTWNQDSSGGIVRLAVTWDNGTDTTTSTCEVNLDASPEQYNAEPGGDGEAWQTLQIRRTFTMPAGFEINLATANKYSRGDLVADLVLSYRKSPRIVDVVVHEIPLQSVIKYTDSDWPSTYYTNNGAPLGNYPLDYPAQKLDEQANGDPSMGTHALLEATEQHRKKLGPCVLFWSSWDEENQAVDSAEADPWTTQNTSWVPVPQGNHTEWDNDGPGAAVGSAGYARGFKLNQWLESTEGTCRLLVAAYTASTSGTTGRVKFQTTPWSCVTLTDVTSTSYAWTTAVFDFSVGVNPEHDDHILQVFAQTEHAAGPGDYKIRYLVAWYMRE